MDFAYPWFYGFEFVVRTKEQLHKILNSKKLYDYEVIIGTRKNRYYVLIYYQDNPKLSFSFGYDKNKAEEFYNKKFIDYLYTIHKNISSI